MRHGGANEFVSNLGNTIKQNPLPFLLTSAGIGWLILAQRTPNTSYANQGYSQHRYASGQYGTPGTPVHEGTHPDAHSHATPSSMTSGTERHHDNLHNMGQRARQAESQASELIQEHPLVVGALGFALGDALGGIFPATKKEEYMGEYRDRILHKAAEAGQEQVDKAQYTIHEKTESFKDKSDQDTGANGTNVDAPQDRETEVKGSPTPFAERPGTNQSP